MSDYERKLQLAVKLAHRHLVRALQHCPNEYGGRKKLERAFAKVDEFRAWFEQTHA